MKIVYDGLCEEVITFLAQGEIKPGDFVRMADNDTVAVCRQGDIFVGVAVSVSGGLCSVKIRGFQEVKTKNWLDVGQMTLSFDENGQLIDASLGHSCLVVNYDNTTQIGTIFMY